MLILERNTLNLPNGGVCFACCVCLRADDQPVFISQRSKRQYFICHGSSNSAASRVHAKLVQAASGADVVYFKNYEHGILFCLYFKHENSKQQSTVEKAIAGLDEMLMTKNNTRGTNFTSLTPTGKVKSFSGVDRLYDFHFREIFNVNGPRLPRRAQYPLQAGVDSWSLLSTDDHLDAGYKELVRQLVIGDGDVQEEEDVEPGAALTVRCFFPVLYRCIEFEACRNRQESRP